MQNIVIKNGRIIDPLNRTDDTADIYIHGTEIIAIAQKPDGFQADLEIDAVDKIVCPGFIDLSVRLREPGATQKGDIQSETAAAAASGITGLCMPPDSKPILDTTAVAELIRDKAELAGYSQVYPVAALTRGLKGRELSSMFTLKQAGCIAVSNAGKPVENLMVLQRAMEYAASHDLLLLFRPEDSALANGGCAHDGVLSARYGLPGIPEIAETAALAQCLELLRKINCRVHFGQISCARSVQLLQQAKASGLNVTADVAMHQLHLSDADMIPFDSAYHVTPPLRSVEDKHALIAGLRDGIIDVICSDHQPHDVDAKLGAFPETEAGICAMETQLPLMVKLVNEQSISYQQAIAALSTNAAAILQLPQGHLSVGSPADICIFDPLASWQVDAQNWRSRGKNTPYWGEQLMGKVFYTIQAGRVIFTCDGQD